VTAANTENTITAVSATARTFLSVPVISIASRDTVTGPRPDPAESGGQSGRLTPAETQIAPSGPSLDANWLFA
jgi:hypothetical protein